MNVSKNQWLFMLFLSSLMGCNSIAPQKEEAPITSSVQSSDQAAAPKTLSFIDLDTFDQEFSSILGSQETKNIDVAFSAPANINEIPTRIKKWLGIIQESGGTVEVTPKTRAIGLSLLAALPQVYAYMKESMFYGPAKAYNAVISYDQKTGIINQLSFIKKESNNTNPTVMD